MSTLATLLRIDCKRGKIKAERQVRKYYRTQRRSRCLWAKREAVKLVRNGEKRSGSGNILKVLLTDNNVD